MALISERYGCLFLMAPRTGCTALGRGVLMPYLEARWLPPEPILDELGHQVVDSKHSTLEQLIRHRLIERDQAARLFKFSTVRNPFDSIVSLYTNMREKYRERLGDPMSWMQRNPEFVEATRKANALSFEDWVLDRFTGQASWRHPWSLLSRRLPPPHHMYREYIAGADFVMRFERLQEDFWKVLDRIGVRERLMIPHLNQSRARERDYRSYYTERARRVVAYVYRPDLKRFGYSF